MRERCYSCDRLETAQRKMRPWEWYGRLRMICYECAPDPHAAGKKEGA
jgi:hypothetical protein